MNKWLQGTSITNELELLRVKNKTEESENDDNENDAKSKTSSKRTLIKKKRNSMVKKNLIEAFNNSPNSGFLTSSSSTKNLNPYKGMILNKNQSSTNSSNSEKNKEIKEVIKEEDEDLDKNLSVPDEKNCQNEILSKIK